LIASDSSALLVLSMQHVSNPDVVEGVARAGKGACLLDLGEPCAAMQGKQVGGCELLGRHFVGVPRVREDGVRGDV
jgi:hypothetical protein